MVLEHNAQPLVEISSVRHGDSQKSAHGVSVRNRQKWIDEVEGSVRTCSHWGENGLLLMTARNILQGQMHFDKVNTSLECLPTK